VACLAEPTGRDAETGAEVFVALDDESGHYLAFNLDRRHGPWHAQPFLHLRVADGRVIVEHNGTDDDVAALLVAEGVPQEAIVLRWLPADPPATEV
jgi:hypothetical protein